MTRDRARESATAILERLDAEPEVAGTDVLPLFRPDGARLEKVAIRRIRAHGETDWEWIGEPAEALTIGAPDVLVTRAEVQRFERRHELYGGATPRDMQGPARRARRRAAGPGAPPRYDWDTFFVAITQRIYARGLPSTQGELVREMLEWFQARQDEHAPDESTVRRKVAMVWRELHRPAL